MKPSDKTPTKRKPGHGNTRGKNKKWLTPDEAVAYIVERRRGAVQLMARAAATKRNRSLELEPFPFATFPPPPRSTTPRPETEERKSSRVTTQLVVSRALRMGFATNGEAHRPILEAREALAGAVARRDIKPRITRDGVRYSWAQLRDVWPPDLPGRRKKTTLGAEHDDIELVNELIDRFLSKSRDGYTISGSLEYMGRGISKTRFTRAYNTALQGAKKKIESDLESDRISDDQAHILRMRLATWRTPRGRPPGATNRKVRGS